jgi:hypothetical protein
MGRGESWQNTDGETFFFVLQPLTSTEIAGY